MRTEAYPFDGLAPSMRMIRTGGTVDHCNGCATPATYAVEQLGERKLRSGDSFFCPFVLFASFVVKNPNELVEGYHEEHEGHEDDDSDHVIVWH